MPPKRAKDPPTATLAATIKGRPEAFSPRRCAPRRSAACRDCTALGPGRALKALAASAKTWKQIRHSRYCAMWLLAIAEGSPFLWDLIRADPERLLVLLEAERALRRAAGRGQRGARVRRR